MFEFENDYITIAKLAVQLQLPRKYVDELIMQGVIPTISVNGRKRATEYATRKALDNLANPLNLNLNRFVEVEELSTILQLPEDYILMLAKNGHVPFASPNGKMHFRIISCIDCIVKLNPQDVDIQKCFELYEKTIHPRVQNNE